MIIIAEAGLNYGGSLDIACNYAVAAKHAGADIVKFQITDVDATWYDNTREYNNLAGDIREQIRACEMPDRNWIELKRYCDSIRIEFMATPSTVEKMKLLKKMGCRRVKIGSDRAGQKDLINQAVKLFPEVLISNGMGYDWPVGKYERFYCVSKYPAEIQEINIRKLLSGWYQGFSDHTLDTVELPRIMAGSGMKYWEKHFKLNNSCIDAAVSLDPYQLQKWIENVRRHCG